MSRRFRFPAFRARVENVPSAALGNALSHQQGDDFAVFDVGECVVLGASVAFGQIPDGLPVGDEFLFGGFAWVLLVALLLRLALLR